jgi:hypothetical protein
MKPRTMTSLLAAALLAGCAASAGNQEPASSAPPSADAAPLGSPFSDQRMGLWNASAPLLIDRTDLRIGTTVHFARVPTASELHDLTQLPGLAHLVLSLPGWPSDYARLESLAGTPPEADVIVVLPGYPPTRAAAEAWNLVRAPLRVIVVVREPPPSSAVVADLNTMRGLERVVLESDQPSRTGFERLQRPLSFRKIVE